MVIHTLIKLGAILAAAAACAWMLTSAPSQDDAILRQYHTFVPLTLMLGAIGAWRGFRDVWENGWNERSEGVVVLSCLTIAWGLLASLTALHRAAGIKVYDVSEWRMLLGLLLIAAVLAVMRWATRHDVALWWRWHRTVPARVVGELPWSIFAVCWMLLVAYQNHALAHWARRVYLAITG